jgi:cell division protein FtsA
MAELTRIAAGLDLGSTKVAMAVVQQEGRREPQILGYAQSPCRFLRQGIVINLEALVAAVGNCLDQLHSLCRIPIQEVMVNLPPGNLKSDTQELSIEFKKKREITQKDIVQIYDSARNQSPEDWKVVHIFPDEFVVDDQRGIASPLGMVGSRLGARIMHISAPTLTMDNLCHSVRKCKFRINHIVLDTLAGIESLVTADERELGVWIVDIGGAYTQMAAIRGNSFVLLPTLNLGGDQVTSDIAIGIRTPIRDAERIKIDHGSAFSQLADDKTRIEILPLGGGQTKRYITGQLLAEIIQPRIDEIFDMVAKTFQSVLAKEPFSAGVFLLGGGSLLPGTVEVAEKHFQMPVIKGNLRYVTGLSDLAPESVSATAIGLALYGLRYPPARIWGQSHGNSIFTRVRSLINWIGGGRF